LLDRQTDSPCPALAALFSALPCPALLPCPCPYPGRPGRPLPLPLSVRQTAPTPALPHVPKQTGPSFLET